VFWNLLSNAVKFTSARGRVTVHVTRGGSGATVRIGDNGRGISAEFLSQVFDRFKQADAAQRVPQAGLGLGLALVREMVQAHGGAVTAESPGEGHGSVFTVTLPLTPQPGQESLTPGIANPSTADV
jgi:signal transduction histidine kinase